LHSEIKTLHLNEPFRIAHGTSATRQVLRISEGDAPPKRPLFLTTVKIRSRPWRILNQAVLPQKLPRTAARPQSAAPRHHRPRHRPKPLSRGKLARLGAPEHPAPPGCRSFSIPDDLDASPTSERRDIQQFSVLKLKLGSGDLGLDLAIVSVARYAAPDANCCSM
jgi:hypothetical protein